MSEPAAISDEAIEWWYSLADKRTGPIRRNEFRELLIRKTVLASTLVWREGMADWNQFADVPELLSLQQATPPALPRPSSKDRLLSLPFAGSWRRFTARVIDISILSIAIGYCIGYLGGLYSPALVSWLREPGSEYALNLLMLPLVLVAEALVFAVLGTTPGKLLLGVRVIFLNSDTPKLAEYLKRQVGVYWYGLGIGFPFVGLFTMYAQHRRLRSGQQTTYDAGLFNAKALKFGYLRGSGAIVAIGAVLAFLAFLSWSRESSQEQRVAALVSSPWTNPVSGRSIALPAGWTQGSTKNEDGDTIYVFSSPTKSTAVVFANEKAGIPLDDYVDVWRRSVSKQMLIEPNGRHVLLSGRDTWIGQGHMLVGSQQIATALTARSGQVWRVLVVAGLTDDPGVGDEPIAVRDLLLSTL